MVRAANQEEKQRGIIAFAEARPGECEIVIWKGGTIDLVGSAYLTPVTAKELAELLLEAAEYCCN